MAIQPKITETFRAKPYGYRQKCINAQRQALNVTGQNIANVNTEGYRRRDADLKEFLDRKASCHLNPRKLGLVSHWERCVALLMNTLLRAQILRKANFNLQTVLSRQWKGLRMQFCRQRVTCLRKLPSFFRSSLMLQQTQVISLHELQLLNKRPDLPMPFT